MPTRIYRPHNTMKPPSPAHPITVSPGGAGQPTPARPVLVPTLPVLQRQSAPQQRLLDLRRR